MRLYSKLSDDDLTALLKQKDHAAFTEIYNRYKGVLFIHAFKLLKDADEAQDVIHELYTTLWDKAEILNFSIPIKAYLYRAVKNKIFDIFSHSKISNEYIEKFAETLEEGICFTDEKISEKELIIAIEAGVAMLPAKMRQIFEMSRLQCLSHKDIAKELSLSDKTVKTQIHNALRILRLKINCLISVFPIL